MDIKSFNATDAKNQFSDLLDAAADHPVRIDRSGKAAAYVVGAADFERIQGAATMARIDRLLAAKDLTVLSTLKAYAHGNLSRQKAIEKLMLGNYAQLLRALDHAGLPAPRLSPKDEEGMIKGLERILHG